MNNKVHQLVGHLITLSFWSAAAYIVGLLAALLFWALAASTVAGLTAATAYAQEEAAAQEPAAPAS